MNMNGAELIIRLLERQGVRTVTGIPGGANLPLYHALAHSRIRHVLARHEQGAGFMAQGMARSTGRAAVCFVTSGPGVTNAITAVADAMLDSVPLILICGQVPGPLLGTNAFQEIDTVGLARPVCKKSYLVKKAEDILRIIPAAFTAAESGRPGPVVIDIPKDIQLASVEVAVWPSPGGRVKTVGSRNGRMVKRIAHEINSALRPVLYVGGGIIASDTHEELLCLARTGGIPIVSTLMGLGCVPASDPLFLGMLGMHGSRAVNLILDKTDLLIALGVRFDDRATGRVSEFCPQAGIIHIDIDRKELHKIKRADHALWGDLKVVFKELLPLIRKNSRTAWINRACKYRGGIPPTPTPGPDAEAARPLTLLGRLGGLVPRETIVCTDVGQHQMWTAQGFAFKRPRTFLTSGGLGTMGFGLPAAMGAALANPDKPVLCISGDGSLYMNIQELATLAELELNVIIILFNNNELGLVRQQQELFYGKVYSASRFKHTPDFAALAREFGIRGIKLETADRLPDAVSRELEYGGPALIEVPVSSAENVFPMVPPGKANREMIWNAAP
jgi:acetolactate synthase-1/2/3 large subunit